MIVHSVVNVADDTCVVQVEGIEPSVGDATVRLFAQGAAGALNKSCRVTVGHLIRWLDDQGRPIVEDDASTSTVAQVVCEVSAP